MTAIYFLLDHGQRSYWHRIDADELWLWHAGVPLLLQTSSGDHVTHHVLGADIIAGQQLQALVPAGAWQTAESSGGWSLVSCVVVPGFDFDGFELAAAGWSPG